MRTSILLTGILLIGAWNVSAQVTKKVLFIGNSYTAYNALPAMVSNMASSTGDELIFDSNTPGGARFLNHATNPTTLNKIAADNWDYVALQAQSQETSFGSEFKETELYPYAEILIDSIRSNYECSEPMFYMTWGRENGDAGNCEIIPWVCTYEGMDDSIRATYTYMAETFLTEIAPTGAVWRYLRENHPEIDLYASDGSHPSLAGSYAASCAFYTMVFKKDPTLVSWNSTLPEVTANIIKEATKVIAFDEIDSWDFTLVQTEANFTEQIDAGQVTFMNTTENFDSIFWDFGDGNSSTEADPTHLYETSGEFTVKLISEKCGKSDTLIKILSIDLTLGAEILSVESFTIFPNPTSDYIRVIAPNPPLKETLDLNLFDLSGRRIASFTQIDLNKTLDLSLIPSGTYLVQLRRLDGVTAIQKLVVY